MKGYSAPLKGKKFVTITVQNDDGSVSQKEVLVDKTEEELSPPPVPASTFDTDQVLASGNAELISRYHFTPGVDINTIDKATEAFIGRSEQVVESIARAEMQKRYDDLINSSEPEPVPEPKPEPTTT